ncbi:MAG: hypothetical protein EBW09_00630 [Actinobacteria bacterium]|nr:hypothetical protein [Actinomycetota bacterium]
MFIFRFIRRVISFILLLIIVVPLYVAGSIWYAARNSEAVNSDVILVMGAAQFDGRPSDMKKAKLNSVIIVTDPYHCYRSVKMAEDLGLTASCDPVKTGPASVTNSGYKYLARETGAYLAYITVGRLGIKLSDRLIAKNLYS